MLIIFGIINACALFEQYKINMYFGAKRMNKLLLGGTAALAICMGVATVSAQASVITYNYDLSGAGHGNNHSYTNQGVTFTGWEYNSNANSIDPAKLYFKNQGSYEYGLGVSCNDTSGPKCSQHEINSSPGQAIDINISSLLAMSGLIQLTIGVGSVDGNGGSNRPESALIWGGPTSEPNGYGAFRKLGQYTYSYDGFSKVASFTFSAAQLAGLNYLEVTDGGGYFGDGSSGCFGNVLLSSLSASIDPPTQVPEPSGSGMFDFGLLAIAALAGLRRRSKR